MLASDIQPGIIDETENQRIVVIGDVHGDIKRFMFCLYNAKVFSKDLEWIAEPKNTVVVQLGDQIDSMMRTFNPEATETPEWEELPDVEMLSLTDRLDSIARLKGGRVLSIIGNHEFMNVIGDYNYVSPRVNKLYDLDLRKANFRKKYGEYTKILAKRNLVIKIGKFLFCHGGILPMHLDASNDNINQINEVFRKSLLAQEFTQKEVDLLLSVISENGIIWTRYYIENADNAEPTINEVLNRTKSVAMFLGHSVVEKVSNLYNKLFLVDTGMSRSFGRNTYQYVDIQGTNINVIDMTV